MKVLRRAAYLGIAGVVIYLGATAAGSVLDPAYSQLRQHVSDLTATGAPTRAALAVPYVAYNLLTFGFAVALYMASERTRLWKLGLALLGVNAGAGVLMVFPFSEDLGGAPTTLTGSGHVLFAAVSSLAIVAMAFVYSVAFRRSASWRSLSRFSVGVGVVFILLAPVAIAATAKGALMGLTERATIGVFLVWIVVVDVHALRLSRSGADATRGAASTSMSAMPG